MAHKLKAMQTYRPKLQRERTLGIDEICDHIARHSSLNEGEIKNVIAELKATIIYFAQRGHGIMINGLGTFRPGIEMDGKLTLNMAVDPSLKKKICNMETYKGIILQKENLGKSIDELVELWNKDHPEDPINE